jgi:hypothetical protein
MVREGPRRRGEPWSVSEDKYRLCYMRGPAGIIVALAEEL